MAGLLALLKHHERIGPGWLLDCCVDRCDFFRVVLVRSPADLPPPETCAGVVIAGPPLSPDLHSRKDRLLREELIFARTVVGLGVNYLGIGCGAQILAWALRGKVLEDAEDGRFGHDSLELTAEGARDGLLGAAGARFPVVRVPSPRLVVPPTAELLAGTPEAPDAFRIGAAAHAMIPHVETTPLMLEEQLAATPSLGEGRDTAKALADVRAHEAEQRQAAFDIMERLIERARRFCPDRPLVSEDDEPIVPV